MPLAEFDHIASSYDNEFTHSPIGLLQRKEVWKYLSKIIHNKKNLDVLEFNCGTGEDAIYLASKSHSVTATDISSEMIKVVTKKAQLLKLEETIDTAICDINSITDTTFKKKYDILFSNFGGFNCIDHEALSRISSILSSYLKKNGVLILVIMPRWCLWEIGYFILKLDFKNAFRRFKKNAVLARVGNLQIKTWYYTKKELKQVLKINFNYINSKPIGIAVPPSYLNNFFKKKKTILNCCYFWERILNKTGLLSNFSDHLLICFHKK